MSSGTFFLLGLRASLSPFKNCHNILQGTIGRLKTKNRKDTPLLKAVTINMTSFPDQLLVSHAKALMAWLKSNSWSKTWIESDVLLSANNYHSGLILNLLGLFVFSLQALRLFRLASELESRATALRLKALQHMTIAMAGIDCKELFTLMTAFFGQGTDFAADPFNYLDGAPSIQPPLDLTDTDSDSEGEEAASQASASTAASTSMAPNPQGPVDILEPKEPRIKSKPKIQYSDKVPSLAQMKGFFPVDKDSLHNTDIPLKYHVKHTGSSQKGHSIYMCPYDTECSTLPYSGNIASAGSHVRHHHLGHSCVCPYCGLRFYNAAGWRDHMTSKHAGMPLYGSDVTPKIYPVSTSMAAAGESPSTMVTIPIPAPVFEPDPVDTLPLCSKSGRRRGR